MGKEIKYKISQLRDYSSLFSRSQVLAWLKNDFSSINFKIEKYDEKFLNKDNSTYLDYLKYIYSILANHYQNEYIFKNEFLNNWLIKELGETNSQIFSEFNQLFLALKMNRDSKNRMIESLNTSIEF